MNCVSTLVPDKMSSPDWWSATPGPFSRSFGVAAPLTPLTLRQQNPPQALMPRETDAVSTPSAASVVSDAMNSFNVS